MADVLSEEVIKCFCLRFKMGDFALEQIVCRSLPRAHGFAESVCKMNTPYCLFVSCALISLRLASKYILGGYGWVGWRSKTMLLTIVIKL